MSRRGLLSPRSKVAWGNVLAALTVTILALFSFPYQWDKPGRRAGGDTYWYLRNTELYLGQPLAVAEARAGILTCDANTRRWELGAGPGPCRHYQPRNVSPRYVAIFENRPGYSILLMPFVSLLGLRAGTTTAAVVVFWGAGWVMYLLLRELALRRLAAVVGAGALLALPSGYTASRVQADGTALALSLLVALGVARIWSGRRSGWAVAASAFPALYLTKSASGAALSIGLLAAACVLALTCRERARRALGVAAMAMGLLLAWGLAGHLLGWPGLIDTVQDMATLHFTRPDIADPLWYLARRALGLWHVQVDHTLRAPWPVIPLVLGAFLVTWRRPLGWVAVSVAVIGVIVVTAHPLPSEFPRLIAPVWVLAAAGAAVSAEWGTAWLAARGRRQRPLRHDRNRSGSPVLITQREESQ